MATMMASSAAARDRGSNRVDCTALSLSRLSREGTVQAVKINKAGHLIVEQAPDSQLSHAPNEKGISSVLQELVLANWMGG